MSAANWIIVIVSAAGLLLLFLCVAYRVGHSAGKRQWKTDARYAYDLGMRDGRRAERVEPKGGL